MENREIKRRRKQFIATLMAFVMIVGSLTGMLPATTAKATDNAYFLGVGSNTTNQYPELSVGDEIDPGVILAFGDPDEEIQPTFTFRYYDFNLLEKFKEVEDSSGSYTVEDYPVNGADKDQFARWKVSRLNTSSGDVLCVNLVAIAGTEEAITYQKSDQNWFDANDMGIPASPPSFYTPGFAMPGDCFPDAELGMYDDNSNYIEYPFIGWFRNGTIGESDLSIRATGIAATETAPVTLYAHFSQNTTKHNISYKTVSCNAIQSDTEYTDHVKFVKRENNPADFYVAVGVPKIGDAETDLEHYTFDGWYDAATGGTKYQSIPRNTTDNVTLYARFVPKEYSITYVTTMGNLEGTVSTDSATGYQYGTGVSVGTGDGMILAAQPNDNHYEFEGWHKQSDFSDDAITGIDTSEYGNVTLYAKYIPRTVALSLDDGEGVSTHGAASPQTLTYDAVLPQITVPTKTGYVFDGYYLEAGSGQANDVQYINANGVWQNVAGVTENNKWKSDADSLSLKAKWTAITASLTLVDGGNVTTAGSAASEQLTYDAAMPEIITVPTKTGYAFSGYYKSGTASQANDVQYINANGVWQQVSGVISDGKWKATDTELVLNAKWTPIQYAIAFDSNGSTDSMNPMTGLKYDAEYSISANTLTKDYYDFDGWKIQGTETTYADQATVKNLTSVNDATVTLVAQWKKKDYTITLDPAGGSVSDDAFTQVQTSGTYQRKYQVGDASFTLPTPTRTEYQFKGWKLEGADPAFNVTITTNAPENRTYTAVWEINRYSVTFKDDDGEVLKAAKSYDYNTPAASIEKPADPAAKRTDEYTYTFAGWSPTIDTVTGDATYTATYTATKNKYNVIWKDEDGTVLQTKEYEYGTLPANIEKPANPTKDRTDEYTYTFNGWTPEIAKVTGEATYTATYKEEKNKYKVTWKNEGQTIVEDLYDYGTVSGNIVKPDNPTKAATAEYTYTFAGWIPAIADVTGHATYTADYTAKKNKYIVTWKDADGTVLSSNELEYGTPADQLGKPADPSKEATPEYTYTFKGWDKEPAMVTGDATYTATYTATKNKYDITWKDENDNTIRTDSIEYGTKAADLTGPEAPAKEGNAEYSYTFAGWNPELADVTGAATYTATYSAEKNKYRITWVDGDGKNIKTDAVEYGTVSGNLVIPDDPAKAPSAEYTYTFAGWEPAIEDVTKDATYTATFTKEIRKYKITWVDGDGKTLRTDSFEYGTSSDSLIIPDAPAKDPAAEYTYTFAGWSPALSDVTQDVTYKAVYTQTKNQYTVTWVDGNGKTLKTESVSYGQTPAYSGDTPQKDEDITYTYTFNGKWSPQVEPVKGEVTYTAQFDKEKKPDKFLDKDDSEADVNGTQFGVLFPGCGKVTKTSIQLKWKKVDEADAYYIYGSMCNHGSKKYTYKRMATITDNNTTQWTAKKLKKNSYYKFYIVAVRYVNGQDVLISKSKRLHITTLNDKYGDATRLVVNTKKSVRIINKKNKVTKGTKLTDGCTIEVKKGATIKIVAKEYNAKKKIKHHKTIGFEVTNERLLYLTQVTRATTYRTMQITAKKKGKSKLYIYAQNGVYMTVNIVVK